MVERRHDLPGMEWLGDELRLGDVCGDKSRFGPAGHENDGEVRVSRAGAPRNFKPIRARSQVDVGHQGRPRNVLLEQLKGCGGAINA